MQNLGMIVVVAIIALIIVAALSYTVHQSKKLNEAFTELARGYGGRALITEWFQFPSAHFEHRGVPILVNCHSTGGKNAVNYTQVHIPWPHANFRCEVYPTDFFRRLGQLLGMTDIVVGAPEFDDAYTITSSDAATVRRMLTPVAQNLIRQLCHVGSPPDVYVGVSGGELLVKVRLLRQLADLRRAVSLSISLHEAMLATNAEGITFLDGGPEKIAWTPGAWEQGAVADAGPVETGAAATDAKPPTCLVCGEGIVTDMVLCRRCKTPHHLECWRYYGACSVYACGELKHMPPPAAKRRGK